MKIPNNATRVYKGIIFDVYNWQQNVFDGSFETFEMLKRVNTVEVIAVMDGKILISHQSQPTKLDYYSLFGGRGEEGEDPITTAKRELLEEAGLESQNWELYRVKQPIHKIDWDIFTYIAKDCKKVANQKLDKGEKIETIECSFDEFIDIVISDKYWGDEFKLEVYKMKDEGMLQDFKEKLLGS